MFKILFYCLILILVSFFSYAKGKRDGLPLTCHMKGVTERIYR